MDHVFFMSEALKEASKAALKSEVPIGAVAVLGESVIGRAHNVREATKNPLGHAELLLMEQIVKSDLLPSWRFDEVTIYVTCEPCIMCMGAMLQARVKKVVYGCSSFFDLAYDAKPNHRIEVVSGIMKDECAKILSDFFKDKRKCRSEN